MIGKTNVGGGGSKVFIDGVKYKEDLNLKSLVKDIAKTDISVITTSSNSDAQLVLFNNELHILGGYNNKQGHYKWNGTELVSVSTLPFYLHGGRAIVFENAIHVIGCQKTSSGDYNAHYKFDGSAWTEVSTFPTASCRYCSLVVFENAIHVIGGGSSSNNSYYTQHYSWNGSAWTKLNSCGTAYNGFAVVHNGKIYSFVCKGGSTTYYVWNGSSSTYKTLSVTLYEGCRGVVFENAIHIICTKNVSNFHYKFDGSTLENVGVLPIECTNVEAVVIDDVINVCCTPSSGNDVIFELNVPLLRKAV